MKRCVNLNCSAQAYTCCQLLAHIMSRRTCPLYMLNYTAPAYVRAVLGVVILSVRLSVTRVDCDKSKWCTAAVLIPHERAITLLLSIPTVVGGRDSEKISIMTNIKSTTDIFIPHNMAITLVFWHQQCLVGDAPVLLKSALKVTHPPSKNANFERFQLITSQS